MQFFNPSLLLVASESMGHHQRSVDESGNPVTNKILPESTRESGARAYRPLIQECSDLGLSASLASAKRLVKVFDNPNTTQGNLKEAMSELHGRLVDELLERYFLALTPTESSMFRDWERGWEAVIERFPEIIRDVEEMNKCFALGRYTAAMFHALHVAEWGAIYLGRHIGAADPKQGWGATEKKLRELMRGGHGALPSGVGSFEFLEQMNREIDSMVLAWRHKVDHAANHLYIVPNTDFTPDIAEHIIGAVRIFMQRLLVGIPV
jgi:hypothetical protein